MTQDELLATASILGRQAWQTPPNIQNIPIDYSQQAFKFTETWFADRNQETYSTFLPPRFPNDKPWRVLLIGVWEGMDLVWLLQNIATHPDSRVTAVDAWVAAGKVSQERMDQVYTAAVLNARSWIDDKLIIHRSMSQEILPTLKGDFDLAIIDGDHGAGVYPDACNSFRLLKPGGWMLFDDVRRGRTHSQLGPVSRGLKKFLREYGKHVDFLWAHRFMNAYEKLRKARAY